MPAVVLMVSALLLCGATRAEFLGDVAVQLIAVPILLFGLHHGLALDRIRSLVVVVVLAALMLPALQLLPIGIGRPTQDLATSGLVLATENLQWSITALAPQRLWSAWLSMLSPFTMFLAGLLFTTRERFVVVGAVLAVSAAAVLLGLLQVAQGPDSGLRLYGLMNATEAVGFFANRNHFAAFLYVSLVFCAVWIAAAVHAVDGAAWRKSRSLLTFITAVTLLVAIVAGLAMARSRAGIVLALAAMLGSGVMFALQHRQTGSSRIARLGVGGIVFAALFTVQLGLERILSRFDLNPFEDLRVPVASTTWEAIVANLPFGTGLGSFVPVYATLERTDLLLSGYMNRAHNDFLEFLLEGGLPALLIMVACFGWYLVRSYDAWVGAFGTASPEARLLARAASIAIALLLAHSLVDYPLRTTALGVLFAFCAALLVPPLFRDQPRLSAAAAPGKPRSQRRREAQQVQQTIKRTVPRERFGAHTDWPDAWGSSVAPSASPGRSATGGRSTASDLKIADRAAPPRPGNAPEDEA